MCVCVSLLLGRYERSWRPQEKGPPRLNYGISAIFPNEALTFRVRNSLDSGGTGSHHLDISLGSSALVIWRKFRISFFRDGDTFVARNFDGMDSKQIFFAFSSLFSSFSRPRLLSLAHYYRSTLAIQPHKVLGIKVVKRFFSTHFRTFLGNFRWQHQSRKWYCSICH